MSLRILVLGATSAISEACLKLWAANDEKIFLVARNSAKLSLICESLKLAYDNQQITALAADLNDTALHTQIFEKAFLAMGGIDRVFICYGMLADDKVAQDDFAVAQKLFAVNLTSQISLLTEAAKHRVRFGIRAIGVVTSVAGDRGRPSNYVYGAGKAGLIAYLSGLRAKLFGEALHVMDVRPGFVMTPMTAGMKRDGFLWSSADRVATVIDSGFKKHRGVVYAPGIWRVIMGIITRIPECVFVRMKL